MAASRQTPRGYEYSVFINCPFDAKYHPLLRASAFCILACGFVPRCALEGSETGRARLEKILAIIGECRFGLHDFSRVDVAQGDLPRFNMPFECGLFWGSMRFGNAANQTKSLKVVDEQPHRYHQYLSDMSGGDIGVHKNSVGGMIEEIRAWLAPMVREQTRVPGGDWIKQHYRKFASDLPGLLAAMRAKGSTTLTVKDLQKKQYYAEFVRVAGNWLSVQPGYYAEPPRATRRSRR